MSNSVKKVQKIVLTFLIFFVTSCSYVKKIDQGIRRTFGQISRFERQQKLYTKRLGLDELNKNKQTDSLNNIQKNPLEQKNMINTYGYLFEGINDVNLDKILDKPTKQDSMTFQYKSLRLNSEVFGWHPYWLGNTWENYPFELLSTLSFFSYSVNPTSGANDNTDAIEEWKKTSLIDVAHNKNTRVLLGVSLYGQENQNAFLKENNLWNNLYTEIGDLLILKNADGIDLNFKDLPYGRSNEFVQFVKEFNQYLNNLYLSVNKPPPFIALTLPSFYDRENYQIKNLTEIVDLFVINGYEYNSTSSPKAVAPLQSEDTQNIDYTVQYYLNQGLPADRAILALPNYGILWNILPPSEKSKQFEASLERKLTLNEIQNLYINSDIMAELELDPLAMNQIYRVGFEDNTMKEIYFDDQFTLSKKYDYAINNNLKGVGIWALGYAGNETGLWKLIETYFSENKLTVTNPISEINGFPINVTRRILQNKEVFIAIIIYLTMAVVLGFILALTDWRIRKSIYRDKTFRLIAILIVFVLLTPLVVFIQELLTKSGWYIKSSFQVYISFFLGMFVFFAFSRLKFDFLKEKP